MEAEEVDKGSVGILPGDNGQVVMTKKQMETLRRQISAFSTICSQLVEMHKVMSQQAYASSQIPVSNQQASGVMTVLLDGKQWELPVGVVDVRKMFGDTALLVDTHGHVVPTNDAGITFHPLHASERYSLIRHVEVKQEMSGKESSDPLIDGLYHCSKHIQ